MRFLRDKRKACETCWEAHPGVCVEDPNFTSIISLHAGLDRALKFFSIAPDDADGQALFFFAGYARKRDAEQMRNRPVVDGITGNHFELAFLCDQPDRRRALRTWALCQFTIHEDDTFRIGSHTGLIQTDTRTLSESVSFAFAKHLRDKAKYWLVFNLVYEDLEDDLHVVKAFYIPLCNCSVWICCYCVEL